ncbi:MAG: hypothetical protein SVK08_02065 [Halobacteriota archaeon]|nr:hypothetical protein [Halobacteriota archaeon]
MNKNILIGWQCPNCGQKDEFFADVVTHAMPRITDDGYDYGENQQSSDFVDGGDASCPICKYTGKISEFTARPIQGYVKKGESMIRSITDDPCKESNLRDALANLQHWALHNRLDFDKALDTARDHFECETKVRDEKTFKCHYTCSECGNEWYQLWYSACDDRCASCNTSCEPDEVEDLL